MAVFRAIGGIGNQLFVASAALAHELQFSRTATIDNRLAAKSGGRKGPHSKKSSLSKLLINGKRPPIRNYLNPYFFLLDVLASIQIRLQGFSRRAISKSTFFFTAEQAGFEESVLADSKVYYRGYFQSYKYLEILREVGPGFEVSVQRPSDKFLEIRNHLSVNKGTVIHIRRGDYRSLSTKFGLLSASYYRDGLKFLQASGQSKKVFAFSDDEMIINDPEFARLFSEFDVEFVSTKELDPTEALLAMSAGQAFVIGNSSFSWWAAALSASASVVHPKPWFVSEPEPRDLVFPEWKPITSSWVNE